MSKVNSALSIAAEENKTLVVREGGIDVRSGSEEWEMAESIGTSLSHTPEPLYLQA